MASRSRPLRPPPTPPKLKRSAGGLPTKAVIFIDCEGKTEKVYFDWVAQQARATGVKVEVVGQRGDPRAVVEAALGRRRALEQQARIEKDSYSWDFETWAVFDVDEHTRIHEAIALARANQIGLAISNPCFELWALLHLTDQTAWIHRRDAQRRLHEEMPQYHHDRSPILDTSLLLGKEHDARRRAAALDRRHEGLGTSGGNPSSSVASLYDALCAPRRRSGG